MHKSDPTFFSEKKCLTAKKGTQSFKDIKLKVVLSDTYDLVDNNYNCKL